MRERLLELIRDRGPIPFDDFMATALYGEGGYFATGDLRSAPEGDFLTSPEVSGLYGETLARFVAAERARSLGPGPFLVVDAGAGSGSLLQPLMAALDDGYRGWAVEVSPAARRALAESAEHVVDSMADLPESFPGVVIANELLDNFPFAVAVRTAAGWEERCVGVSGDELAWVARPARRQVSEWADRYSGPVAVDGIVEVQLQAGAWMVDTLARLTAGAVLIVDYGDTAEGLAPRRTTGTLRTYRAHHVGPDPLLEPGETDITADVNFTALAAAAQGAGAHTELHRQEDFLEALGLRERLRELRSQELALARAGEAMERLVRRSRITEAETLLHPRGLGDFRVLVARPSPVPPPP